MGRQITKAVIPAAGLGTRFLPATKASPKEMLPLVDKPLIQYVVEEAVGAGIREIIIITGRGKRAIEDHFDISFELEETLRQNGKLELMESLRKISDMADFCYIRQRQALGLGHAILSAKNLIGDEPFAVLLGDDIIDHPTSALQQMIDLYQKNQAPLIGIQKVPKSEVRQYGVIDAETAVDGLYKINDLVEKPSPKEAPSNLAVIGRYILTPEIFALLEKTKPGKNNEIQLTDALKDLARLRNMYGYVIQGKRFDAGDKLGFLKATVEMGLKNPELGKEFRKYLKDLPL
ncbi:MAG: UTP--glucose-1-phosphate uridylyltransferase GalU [Candidatus Manganitrophus sp.]|nr:UTP--glucose-1-phosphate uridylyltransferase GalU [Candidatus Manganitrophus sp.]MDC4224727.1 UTP--glucose-1-phosphate uridylyltransferase GalU [Candidatus Manganitrophus sp.]WDT70317.1 MAG: UTP--glucose-1-phosphate uridylyltransferase GalU [Candidatus Manganitrophus sp.]WDT77419.1 MAG: UTP--glucose-1-phosphate uridylyltransferase GalU [Candidatus Manganitrophus sp.]WDT78032.1 MAG: UTP--glucose-1-phosphate uridylyltransferase GalU [Candidatus Manganitrophus sp.]